MLPLAPPHVTCHIDAAMKITIPFTQNILNITGNPANWSLVKGARKDRSAIPRSPEPASTPHGDVFRRRHPTALQTKLTRKLQKPKPKPKPQRQASNEARKIGQMLRQVQVPENTEQLHSRVNKWLRQMDTANLADSQSRSAGPQRATLPETGSRLPRPLPKPPSAATATSPVRPNAYDELAIVEAGLKSWVQNGGAHGGRREEAVNRIRDWSGNLDGRNLFLPLDLSGLDLNELPPHLPGALKHLQLRNNRLATLPPRELLPAGLLSLDARGNPVTALPDDGRSDRRFTLHIKVDVDHLSVDSIAARLERKTGPVYSFSYASQPSDPAGSSSVNSALGNERLKTSVLRPVPVPVPTPAQRSPSPTTAGAPVLNGRELPHIGSHRPVSLERKLKDWIAQASILKDANVTSNEYDSTVLAWQEAELASRRHAAGIIREWERQSRSSPDSEMPPLDLSAREGMAFSSMPPLPGSSRLREVKLKNQGIGSIEIGSLPKGLKQLDLSGCDLFDVDIENVPESMASLSVTLGETRLPARVLRKLADCQRTHFNFTRSSTVTGDREYSDDWKGMHEALQNWVDDAGADVDGRKTAVRRLEEWMHHDHGENHETPLDLGNLRLTELFPVWPKNLTYVDAKGNRLSEIPLYKLPESLATLDLRNNRIDSMPMELTLEQLQLRGRKFRDRGTPPDVLAKEMSAHGASLSDPRIVDPRERGGMVIILNGNPLDGKTMEDYELRESGPEYIFSPMALATYAQEAKREALPDASFFQSA
ncbi:hypothetical protein [Noviherbaspirillum malthae]|uniref:hypothetical protein n=1 Tax=Noviherbaspirillum malthae TaxID=1260987 RepID=UPI001890AD1E|nr:hypothetical protein [Noviherbaspirillum malthae]